MLRLGRARCRQDPCRMAPAAIAPAANRRAIGTANGTATAARYCGAVTSSKVFGWKKTSFFWLRASRA